ncbi:MAG: SxtJ family membrane protein [Burkholderiales bacterium]
MSQNFDSHPALPSERKFGLLFTFVFVVGACYAFWVGASAVAIGLFLSSIALAALALFFPQSLRTPNKLWFKLGLLIGRIVSPIVLGAIFFLLITPIALLTRLGGRDVLLMKKRDVASYWVVRDPVGPPADSFKNQF